MEINALIVLIYTLFLVLTPIPTFLLPVFPAIQWFIAIKQANVGSVQQTVINAISMEPTHVILDSVQ